MFEYDELEFQRTPNPRDHMVNIWGYSHLNFFAPMSRFAGEASLPPSLTCARGDCPQTTACVGGPPPPARPPRPAAARPLHPPTHHTTHHARTLRLLPPAADGGGPVAAAREFKEMVRALHAEGIEVILDVVYNHTVEGE